MNNFFPYEFQKLSILNQSYLFFPERSRYVRISDCIYDILEENDMNVNTTSSIKIGNKYSDEEILKSLRWIKDIQEKFTPESTNNIDPASLVHDEFTLKLIPTRNCNLHCDYCFNTDKNSNWDMDLATAKSAIDYCITHFYRDGMKLSIDLSGAGEPLLCYDFLLKVNEYIQTIRIKKKINIFMQFVTNGIKLSQEVSSVLKKNNILYGVSLDGGREENNTIRLGKNYTQVINNIQSIEDKQYFGLAATLTGENYNIIQIFSTLYNLNCSDAISIKPMRIDPLNDSSISIDNIEEIKKSYSDFTLWILNKVIHGNFHILGVLLRGDDFFGNFLSRIFYNQKIIYRCGAGVTSISVDSKGRFILCPAGIDQESFVLGDLKSGLNNEKILRLKSFFADNNDYCSNCWARYICGGECFVNSVKLYNKLNKPAPVLCNLKKHLISLSVLFWSQLQIKHNDIYKKLFTAIIADKYYKGLDKFN